MNITIPHGISNWNKEKVTEYLDDISESTTGDYIEGLITAYEETAADAEEKSDQYFIQRMRDIAFLMDMFMFLCDEGSPTYYEKELADVLSGYVGTTHHMLGRKDLAQSYYDRFNKSDLVPSDTRDLILEIKHGIEEHGPMPGGSQSYHSRGGGRRGCFIASAAYGTPFSEDINVLRFWRDEALLEYNIGKYFVEIYYRISPPIADWIRNSEFRRKVTRQILKPTILMCRMWKGRERS